MGSGSLQGTVLGAGPRGVGGDGGSPGSPEMASGAQNLFPLGVGHSWTPERGHLCWWAVGVGGVVRGAEDGGLGRAAGKGEGRGSD